MPVPITASDMAGWAASLEDARDRLHLEFRGLTNREAYRLAFARMLKPDPLGRVAMLGNDQRDLFLPLLRELVGSLPAGAQVLDAGGGNGQTFLLAADAARVPLTVHVEDPDPAYVRAYVRRLGAHPRLAAGRTWATGLEELLADPSAPGPELDAVLAIHMVYFLADLPAALRGLTGLLRPGGRLLVVFADERVGLTGGACRAWYHAAGRTSDLERHGAVSAERHRLLGPLEEDGGQLAAALPPEWRATFVARRQESRLYGHTLGDLVALCQISELAPSADDAPFELAKLDSAVELLARDPQALDLRVETEGPRAGMLSAAQPQVVATIERRGGA